MIFICVMGTGGKLTGIIFLQASPWEACFYLPMYCTMRHINSLLHLVDATYFAAMKQ